MKKSILIPFFTILGLLFANSPSLALSPLGPGSLVRGVSRSAVYYVGPGNGRYVFLDSTTYNTWYDDFSRVMTISDAELATMQLRGNVGYRPGSRLIRTRYDPKVYAVSADKKLRWIQNEATARALYGNDWNMYVDTIPEAFFAMYRIGDPIYQASDFNLYCMINNNWSPIFNESEGTCE
ncbi:MAG: hypothetical protein WCJ29_03005 [bacterium]